MLSCKPLVRYFWIVAVALALSACGDSKEKSGESVKSTGASNGQPGAQQQTSDSALHGMVASLMEQSSKQGVPIDAASNEAALTTLVKIYLVRPDLRQAYGEVFDVNLSALMQWASTAGVNADANKALLAPHAGIYAALATALNKGEPVHVKLEWR